MNSLLFGLPDIHINKLKHVQHAAARLVTGARKSDHITPILEKLHWLPLTYRIQYKVIIFVYKALHHLSPRYICDFIKPVQNTRTLRSATHMMLEVPKSRTVTYGDRSFRCAGPRIWNVLP